MLESPSTVRWMCAGRSLVGVQRRWFGSLEEKDAGRILQITFFQDTKRKKSTVMVHRYNPDIHRRRSVRLKSHDYRVAGAYFVTICSFQRECLFGEVIEGGMMLNAVGSAVVTCWQNIPGHFLNVEMDTFVVMPNHFHAVLHITDSTVGAKQGVSASPGSEGVCGYEREASVNDDNKGEADES